MRVPTGDAIPALLHEWHGALVFIYQCLSADSHESGGNVNLYGRSFPASCSASLLHGERVGAVGLESFRFGGVLDVFHLQGSGLILRPELLIMPLAVLHVLVTGLGFGLCVAAASVRFRDIKYLLPTIIQFWMFATPIFYSTSQVSPELRRIIC